MTTIKRVSKALVDIRTFSEKQMNVINAIIAYYDAQVSSDTENSISEETRKRYAKRQYRRVEILNAHRATSDKTCNPYFVSKNVFLHDSNAHLFNLAKAKLATAKQAKQAKLATAKQATIEASEAIALIEA